MSVVSANEIWESRKAAASLDGVTYNRAWKVVTDSVTDGPYVALHASGIPIVGDPYPDDYSATARKIEPRQMDPTRLVWIVEVEYSTPTRGGGGGSSYIDSPNVLEKPAEISFRFITRNRVVDKAYTIDPTTEVILDSQFDPTQPIWNSALLPYDEPLMQDYSYMQIVIKENRADFNADQARLFIDTMNKTAIPVAGITIPIRMGLLQDYSGTKAWALADRIPGRRTVVS